MLIAKSSTSWGKVLVVLLALAAGRMDLAAQSASPAPGFAPPTVDPAWPGVHLNILVLDKQGVPQKVDDHALQLFEQSAERPLHVLAAPDSPVSLALLIDSSGSTFQRKDRIVAAVKALIPALPDGSEVMAVLFLSEAYLDLPFTPASKVDFSFLDRLQPGGTTALYDAVAATTRHVINHAKFPRRALVILSDGEDNASHISRGAAFRDLQQPGAPLVYSCVLSKANILQRDKMIGQINLKFLAKASGGVRLFLDPGPEAAASQISADIRSQYAVEFTAANPARDGKARKLAVRLPVKDDEVHVIPAYFAPESWTAFAGVSPH